MAFPTNEMKPSHGDPPIALRGYLCRAQPIGEALRKGHK